MGCDSIRHLRTVTYEEDNSQTRCDSHKQHVIRLSGMPSWLLSSIRSLLTQLVYMTWRGHRADTKDWQTYHHHQQHSMIDLLSLLVVDENITLSSHVGVIFVLSVLIIRSWHMFLVHGVKMANERLQFLCECRIVLAINTMSSAHLRFHMFCCAIISQRL